MSKHMISFQITTGEMEDFIEAFKHPTQTRDDGISLNNINYKCVRADKFSIYGRKVLLIKIWTITDELFHNQ